MTLQPAEKPYLVAGDLRCEAQDPLLGFAKCGAPGVAVYDYGCIHEHVKRRLNCALHEPVPGAVGCRDCWEQGHECAMIARRAIA
jgi:hypothetical protein